jgi:hypothetical protein
MLEKLEHIERLRAELDDRRAAVLERLAVLKSGISSSEESVETMETTTDPFVRHETPADSGAADPR